MLIHGLWLISAADVDGLASISDQHPYVCSIVDVALGHVAYQQSVGHTLTARARLGVDRPTRHGLV